MAQQIPVLDANNVGNYTQLPTLDTGIIAPALGEAFEQIDAIDATPSFARNSAVMGLLRLLLHQNSRQGALDDTVDEKKSQIINDYQAQVGEAMHAISTIGRGYEYL